MTNRSKTTRLIARMLVASQLMAGVPVFAAQERAQTAQPPAAATAPPETPKEESRRPPNRTVPTVTSPRTVASLSATPSDAELTATRIFSEPLIPMSRPTSAAENAALSRAIAQYAGMGDSEKVAPLLAFLATYPESAWKPSLLANLGTVYRSGGYLGRALMAWEQAWNAAKSETARRPKAVADFALGEWLDQSAAIGRADQISSRLDEIGDRVITGRAAQKVSAAREALGILKFHHEEAAPSGPMALESILGYTAVSQHQTYTLNPLLQHYHAMASGTSLRELQTLAKAVGLTYEMAFRSDDASFPVPSVIHWRVDHYSALLKKDGGRYLLVDSTLGGEKWVTRDALNEEASGYVLAPKAALDSKWRVVPREEAEKVIGHCTSGKPDDRDPCPCGGGGGGSGMAVYTLQTMPASLRLTDQPLTYTAPVGPQTPFRLTYNQRDAFQAQIPTSSNLGPKWTFDWLSWVEDSTSTGDAQAEVILRGGGSEYYSTSGDTYPTHWRSRATLVKVSESPVRYERRIGDGGVEVFALSDGVIAAGRHTYLTEIIDPQGLSVNFTYDANLRLIAVVDAIGQVTTLSYELLSDSTKITKVTDPYGRFATLTYNDAGELAGITDAIGITSSFGYASADFVTSLTTPYGTTRFATGTDTSGPGFYRSIQATDPLGGTERVEFRWSTTDIAATAPTAQEPTGFTAYNQALDHYNSFYWDKRAMALYAGDVTKATITHWLLYTYVSYVPFLASHAFSTSVPHSVKRPLENRVWYAYADQDAGGIAVGSSSQPIKTGRVLDDGTTQASQATYNSQGQPTTRTDPLGRQTTYIYAANGIDPVEIHQTSPGVNDLLGTFTNYTALHQPQIITDSAGQATMFGYDASGQLLSSTNAQSETTTSTYNADHRLESVTAPVAGAVTSNTYDSYGRLRTVTEPDGYVVTTDYDAFDRPTRVTYPDGTTELLTYDRLDISSKTDRIGRMTRYFYDPLRRLNATTDPAGRTMTQQWCACGSLDKITDANGHSTTWERDVQARPTRELRADGTTATQYAYDVTTSRVRTVSDPKGQATTYTYNLDDSLQQVAYTSATIATPSVSYTYDTAYARLATMLDGTGTTTYTYHPAGALGATRVASVDGPLMNDTVTYEYDQLGRLVSRAVNSVATTQTFDTLGRLTAEINLLGMFTYGYDGVTARRASVTYPNGQTTAYTYFNHVGDDRLQTIYHRRPDASTLSKFDYTYDGVGNVQTWQQQVDNATPTVYQFGYDAADQLTAATNQTTELAPTVVKRFAYAYDRVGNRTSEQIDDAATTASHDALNRLTSQQGGGALVLKGTVSEPAAVTVQGTPITVDSTNRFSGSVPAPSGTTTVVIAATDGSGNQSTASYEVDQASASTTLTYDANGNLTADGTRIFEWDARNQLVAVTVGTHRSEFTYDGQHRRVRELEEENGIVESDMRVLWCGTMICEERSSDGAAVINSFFNDGVKAGSDTFFYVRDHLDSIREMTDTEGVVRARYDYDASGRRTKVAGDADASFGFTGHYTHLPTGLLLALYRVYDPGAARWLSEDPSGLKEGPNLYEYARSSPVNAVDPLGLQSIGTGPVPPLDSPPLDCKAAGPWKLTGSNTSTHQQRQWRLVDVRGPHMVSPPGGADAAPFWICACVWRQTGIVEITRTDFFWSRPITCCYGSSTQFATNFRQALRNLPLIESLPARESVTSGRVIASTCACNLAPPPVF